MEIASGVLAETLHCADCDLPWTRELKRGTKPARCPVCTKAHRRDYKLPDRACEQCGEVGPIAAHGLCQTCYKRPTHECGRCGEFGPTAHGGICYPCYWRDYKRPSRECGRCGEVRPHQAHGLCRPCYRRDRNPPTCECKQCGEVRPHGARGLCRSCYKRDYEPPTHECEKCGELGPIAGNGCCKSCWSRDYEPPAHECGRCGEVRPIAERDNWTCGPCYNTEHGLTIGWITHADRIAIYERDNWTCGICDDPVKPDDEDTGLHPHLDHIRPRAHGGSDAPANLRLAHARCNMRRGAPEDWRTAIDTNDGTAA